MIIQQISEKDFEQEQTIKETPQNYTELPNNIFCAEFSSFSKQIPDNYIDLIVTSPPYGDCRIYNGYIFNYKDIINSFWRILKDGAIVVWVVNDETIKGNESGESFKQALYFKEIGFNLHDTMIYLKNTSSFPARRDGNRYTQIFEYMFVFSKGKPRVANLICDKENRWKGWVNWGKNTHRAKDGILVETPDIKPVPEFSPRNNVWFYEVGAYYGQQDDVAYKHPATGPINLAIDHIKTWTNENDLVLDPMVGSGTSCIAAKMLGRKYLGVDISEEYCKLSRERLEMYSKESYEIWQQKLEAKRIVDKEKRNSVLGKLTEQERLILGFPGK